MTCQNCEACRVYGTIPCDLCKDICANCPHGTRHHTEQFAEKK